MHVTGICFGGTKRLVLDYESIKSCFSEKASELFYYSVFGVR
jgi:hypothetical protein